MADLIRSVDALVALYGERGTEHYGEGVSQIEHALQTAALARVDGATDALVAAALLHDVGHLVAAPRGDGDDRHEILGARALRDLMPRDVVGPIALHVRAKRYLCATEPEHLARLSPASIASLAAQGGPLDAVEQTAFERLEHADDALRLRRWDDAAKDPTVVVGSFEDFSPLLSSLATA